MKTKYIKISVMYMMCFLALCSYANPTIPTSYSSKDLKFETRNPSVQKIQLALLLDTSNSMDGLINQAKNQLWETISFLSRNAPEAEIEIALYHYGNDRLSIHDDYVDQVLSFTSNLDKVSSALFSLRTNGGSEYCGSVINKSTQELLWDNKATTQKVLVIAGNETFTQGSVSYSTAITKARKKSIQVNTIYCGNPKDGIYHTWVKGAELGSGKSFTINHNKDIQQIATPYDDAILECNTKINKTYVPIYEEQNVEKEEMEANDIQQGIAQRERLVEKALIKKNKNIYKKDNWDAVDNYISNKGNVSSLKKSGSGTLNDEFEGKSDKEIVKYVEELKKERDTQHKKLEELEIKRQKYISENKKQSDEETLGEQLVNAILK